MRKLKSTLAVVLVLVMALTMVPFAAANTVTTVASFTDAADVTPAHVQALDVLAAADVLRGEDGRILPQRPVTRAEAATIVARLLLGPRAVDELARTNPRTGFRDVDGVSGLQGWAVGPIAHLHDQGIIIGIGDNLFDPFGTVTGAELATMLLRAVGFGANGEYTGPRWEANAIVDGMHWRILSGNYDFTAPATREQVFRWAYNSLNSPNHINGLRFVNWSADRQAYVPVLLLGVYSGAGDGDDLMTIWRRVFMQSPYNMRRTTPGDMWGRPATRYTIGGLEIGVYPGTSAVRYTTWRTTAQVNEDIQNFGAYPGGVRFFVNGNDMFTMSGGNADTVVHFNNTTQTSLTNRATLGAEINRLTGNGVEVEVFVNHLNEITRVTVIRTDIAQVTRIAGGDITVTPMTDDDSFAPPANPAHYMRNARFAATPNALVVTSLMDVHEALSEFALEASVLVRPVFRNGNWEVGEVAAPESVTGVLRTSSVWNNLAGLTGSFTVGDSTYRRARIVTSRAAYGGMTAPNQTVTLLLDTFGYVVDTALAGVSTREIMFVREVGTGLQGAQLRPLVRGWYPDGTAAEVIFTGYRVVPGGAGGTLTVQDVNNPLITVDAPLAGSIIRIDTTQGLTRWVDAATPEADTGIAPELAAQGFRATATVVSLDNSRRIGPNQATLQAGGQNLRFADDARYFFWNTGGIVGPAGLGDPGRFSIRDRNVAIDPAAGAFGTGVTYGSNVVMAVVEYRSPGQAPVISALWIGAPATTDFNVNNLVFVQFGQLSPGVIIDGVVYQTARAFDVNGNALTWNAPEGWPIGDVTTSWIAVADRPSGTGDNAWYTFTIDNQNRFVLDLAVPLTTGEIGQNLGVFNQVPATANGVSLTTLPFQPYTQLPTPPSPLGVPGVVDPTIVNSARMTAMTVIRGTPGSPDDRAGLVEAIEGRNNPTTGVFERRPVNVSLVIDNTGLATYIFVDAGPWTPA